MRKTALSLAVAGCMAAPIAASTSTSASTNTASTAVQATSPALVVTTVVRGLDIPWDVKPLPNGRLLITERDTRRLLLWNGSSLRGVRFPSASVWSRGETGLMSLAIDPRFASNRRFYTCSGGFTTTGNDVRVRAWKLRHGPLRARLIRTLVSKVPATDGRHGGCRLLITSRGSMLVGTGDAATGTNPRDLSSLGGKTLRVNRFTGAPLPGNPFVSSRNPRTRLIWTFGHRNVQGLAERADHTLWSVEHGSYRDDEINLLQAGGDYGWNPVPGYNEAVPMTDQNLEGEQVEARWSSGTPTLATSGATFVKGSAWGSLDGTLAVAALKSSRLMFFPVTAAGMIATPVTPPELTSYGRLRSVTRLRDGSLLVSTSNGGQTDQILRVRPAS